MKIINKTGRTGKTAKEIKERFTEYHEGHYDTGFQLDKNGGEITMNYNFTNHGNSWNRSTFYYHYTKAGNLVIE